MKLNMLCVSVCSFVTIHASRIPTETDYLVPRSKPMWITPMQTRHPRSILKHSNVKRNPIYAADHLDQLHATPHLEIDEPKCVTFKNNLAEHAPAQPAPKEKSLFWSWFVTTLWCCASDDAK